MKKEMILFDLDGTLLPMDQELFTNVYFKHLTQKIAPYGYEPARLVDGIWQGTRAMVKNDGLMKNRERFWSVFSSLLGNGVRDLEDEFTSFYRNEFHRAREATSPNPLAANALALARQKARRVVLATNPIFPLCGIETRLSWIGLSPGDFDHITSYESASSCKPNPLYYGEILGLFGAKPGDCLMVGNDLREDALACAQMGIDSYLVTDCLIDHGLKPGGWPSGSFAQMLSYLESL